MFFVTSHPAETFEPRDRIGQKTISRNRPAMGLAKGRKRMQEGLAESRHRARPLVGEPLRQSRAIPAPGSPEAAPSTRTRIHRIARAEMTPGPSMLPAW
jgi:hypothetical protein